MYKVVKRDCPMFGIGPYVCEFICDTASDVSTLPTSTSEGTGGKSVYDNQKCASGSIAIVAENGSESKQYMLNNQDIWCPYSVAAGSSGGGSSGSSITVDFALSNTSENPVANKVIVAALDDKANVGDIPNIKVNEAVNADTVNGHSVNADVPENAKFTDTIPDLSPYALKSKYGDTTINVGRKDGTTVGRWSTAEGHYATASGDYSHAEGASTTASDSCSHAEGYLCTASSDNSHAEGNNTTASGAHSHSEGDSTTASGIGSHSGGASSTASGDYSFSHGFYVESNNSCEVSLGKFNKSSSDTRFSIGDGTSDTARHNAFEITTTGGKLHDKDIATTDIIPDLSEYAKKSDIPTKLPANGGNADTIGGLAANEIAINPNLLINPDFKINQRGQSSYTGAVYGVDRWTGIYGGETVEITDYGISATFTNNQGIRQFIENSDQYKGKHMTMSVCYNLKKGSYGDRSYCGFALADGNSNSIIINTGSDETHDEFVVKSVTGVVPSDASNLFFGISGNGVIGIKWVKLEIGRIVTPFVAPVPAIERLKIQAMDGKINPYVTGSVTVNANSNVCVSNHGFTPCAVVWWDGSLSGVAVSFSDTKFTIDKTNSVDRTINYLMFK